VIARFLALLDLYRAAVVVFDQPEALGELVVRWTGDREQSAPEQGGDEDKDYR
jgi:segregation and condensation protein A